MVLERELSIYNWIEYNGHPNMVLAIHSPAPREDVRFDGKFVIEINPPDSFFVPIDEVSPLRLTEDMLKVVGFEQYPKHIEYYRKVRIAAGTMLLEYNLEEGSLFIGDRVINVEYFHELQNIIYDLSNDKEDISL